MAWSESQLVVCRQHPFQNPQPGFCPCCLRERLSRLAAGNNSCNYSQPRYNNLKYNHGSFYSSDSSSGGGGSPAGRSQRRRHQRVASDVMGSISSAISGLHKSRSVAYAARKGGIRDDLKRKKKGGFWNKLRLLSAASNRG